MEVGFGHSTPLPAGHTVSYLHTLLSMALKTVSSLRETTKSRLPLSALPATVPGTERGM